MPRRPGCAGLAHVLVRKVVADPPALRGCCVAGLSRARIADPSGSTKLGRGLLLRVPLVGPCSREGMDSCRSLLRSLGNNLSYTTTVSLRIKSKLLFAIHVLLCLGILTYIGIYAIWISEGYQKSCPVVGAVYVKPKGQAYIGQYNTSSFEEMDVSDLVESSAFGIFLTSALTRTEQVRVRAICNAPGGTYSHMPRGQCSAVEESQDPQGKEACEEDADCGEPGTRRSDMDTLMEWYFDGHMQHDVEFLCGMTRTYAICPVSRLAFKPLARGD
eukprot:scaffold13_cov377-Prasinococcus_capsulatus_cf.AAC.15